MSSASEPSPSHTQLRFVDFLDVLRSRGYEEKASQYAAAILVECLLRDIHDIDQLTVENAINLISIPPSPPGWDHHYWGSAVLG